MPSPTPPRLATRFLLSFLREDIAEEVVGDLEEKFIVTQEKKSALRAKINYWFQVGHYFRPFAIRRTKTTNHIVMFRHSILLAFRNFLRYKSSFFINLTGLSTGLACTLLIWLWVNDELNFDKFHQYNDRLYQIMENSAQNGGIKTHPSVPDLLGETMISEMPEIEYAVMVTPYSFFGKFLLINKEDNLKATGQFVGKDFFTMFSYPLLHGSAATVMQQKNSIVISEELSMRLFKTTENVIGKPLDVQILNFKDPVVVTGIYKTIPANSSEQFDFAISFDAWKELSARVGRQINWDNHAPSAFVVLKERTNVDDFNKKIKGYLKTKNPQASADLTAVRFSDRYLYGKYENGKESGGRIEYVKLFSIIAVFILLIACINFMNLSTARASRRTKEIGVKKAVGASRGTLIAQYLTESMLITFLSLLAAVFIVALLIPQFNFITGKSLRLSFSPGLLLSVFSIAIATGFIAGSYPALYLSGFNVVTILKGKINSSFGELIARKGLVVFQFTISIILIVCVAVVYKQIDYVQTTNLGYDKDNIIIFSKDGSITQKQEAFLAEMKKVPGVVNASSISTNLMGSSGTTSGLSWEGKDPGAVYNFESVTVNYDMIETLGLKMASGRPFSRDYKTDDTKIIFNEAAIDLMGIADPVGKSIVLWGQPTEIIGVVRNFHFESLRQEVKPQFFRLNGNETLNIMVKIEKGKEKQALTGAEKVYAQFNPGLSFDYTFLDENYQIQYQAEKRVSILSRYFAGFAILISCLGLFGLAAFTAERRIKEIGIRKILGSGVAEIVFLLTGEFTKIVVVSIVIALPASYFIARLWLETFAFRIALEIWFFAGAGIAALVVAWLTVGIQTWKAAKVNPTECLRD